MKKFCAVLILLFSLLRLHSQPYCIVKNYDEESGLSQRLVKGIVQDKSGYIWIATWNGLNRFDGHEFASIRPGLNDEAYRYSNRLSDIQLSPSGHLLCRIDDRISLFDVDKLQFIDLHGILEEALDTKFFIKQILPTEGKEIVLSTKDGRFITIFDETVPDKAKISTSLPDYTYRSKANRSHGDIPGFRFEDLVLSRTDSIGTLWLITRDGRILSREKSANTFTEHERLLVAPGSLYYCTTDQSGNVWLRSSEGAHRITLGHRPYSSINSHDGSMIRTAMLDSRGRIWLSESDVKAVSVMDYSTGLKKYLSFDGHLSDSFVSFGAPVYAMTESGEGSIWFGSKPDGSFRLTPDGTGSYKIDRFDTGNTYGFAHTSDGALWIATMGKGVIICKNPHSDKPEFLRLADKKGYPDDARLVRQLSVAGDSIILGATTAGLLAIDMCTIGADSLQARLLTSEPGVASSLGNIAVMDVSPAHDGSIVVATESDGINIASPSSISMTGEWEFSHHDLANGLVDVALAIESDIRGNNGWHVVTSNHRVFLYHPSTGRKIVYGPRYWGKKLRFTDARPVTLPDGTLLLSHDNGAIIMSADTTGNVKNIAPVMFTAVSIEGESERLLSSSSGTITLDEHQRNLLIKFSTLDFNDDTDTEYFVKFGDEEWVNVGHQHSMTLLDLTPGEYTLSVRATSPEGLNIESIDSIKIIVTPTIWETTTAKILYTLFALALVALLVWTIIYIRRIKQQKRDILTAYLNVVNAPEQNTTEAGAEKNSTESLPINDDDRELMNNVSAYVADHIADSDITVDDMAAALAISRSSLNRKMKSIMGVSPAEFIRESRLNRAVELLSGPDRSIKEIAYDCGFADLNYFGKCFKSWKGMTPGAYRKSVVK